MLLSLMRKHAKSWLIKFFIAIIAVVFIFYFGYSFRAERALKIAYVNGELISGQEYQKTYRDLVDALRTQYKDFWNDSLIEAFNLKNRALEDLISRKLVEQEAKRLGFQVTDEEIQRAISRYPAFQVNGQFEVGRYRSLLAQNRMTPEDFEAGLAQELLGEKVRQFLLVFMPVTEQEVLDQYTFSNEKVKISFVQFKPEDFKGSITPDQKALEQYFKDHQETYRVPEKIKITYVEIDPESSKDKTKIGEEEIKEYYEYHPEAFREPKQVKVRHILFKLNQEAQGDEEDKVKQKARAVLEEARKGEDFAALASKYSEGPTKSEGGDLGYISPGTMVRPFEEAAFKLEKGEISDLVRTSFGYHIIKVEDIKEERVKELDEVREQIKEALVQSSAIEMAHERGLSLVDEMPYEVDLGQFATKHDLSLKHTDYFSRTDPVPMIGNDAKLTETVFSIDKGETSSLIEQKNKFYILQVVDKKPSSLPEMNEVFDKVKEDYISSVAGQEAKSAAEKHLAALREGKSWDEMAKEANVTPVTVDFFSRRDPIPQIGYLPDMQEAAFALSEQKRFPEKVFESANGAFVIRWEAYEAVAEEDYQKEKERYRFALEQSKQRRVFQKWLEGLRAKAEIEIVTPVTGG